MIFQWLFWISPLRGNNSYYKASKNGCLADLGFVDKKIITLCGINTPPTNVNADYIFK